MYFQDKLKKKQVGRQVREREKRERWRKKEWQPFTQTWYMFSFKKITWCCVLNTEVLSSQGFLQSHKNMLTNHMVPWNYRFILHILECIRSINCKKKLEKWKKKMDNSNVARNWSHISWKDLKVWILWLKNCFFL